MNVRFLRVAQAEFDEAMALYRSGAPGLDQAFRADVVAKLEQIASCPHSSPELAPDVRRAALRRFPFLIIYTLAGRNVVVLAVGLHAAAHADLARSPRGHLVRPVRGIWPDGERGHSAYAGFPAPRCFSAWTT